VLPCKICWTDLNRFHSHWATEWQTALHTAQYTGAPRSQPQSHGPTVRPQREQPNLQPGLPHLWQRHAPVIMVGSNAFGAEQHITANQNNTSQSKTQRETVEQHMTRGRCGNLSAIAGIATSASLAHQHNHTTAWVCACLLSPTNSNMPHHSGHTISAERAAAQRLTHLAVRLFDTGMLKRCFRERTSVQYVVVRRYALKYALCTFTVKGAVTYWLTA
jgi:hypothetical protein